MLANLGVGSRLLLAFLGISGFAVLAAAAAMYSFLTADAALDEITSRRVPTALASLELSRQADALVIAAPGLLEATTLDEHLELSEKIEAEVDIFEGMLAEVKESADDPRILEALDTSGDWLSLTVINLSTLVGTRLVVAERMRELMSAFTAAHPDIDGYCRERLSALDLRLASIARTLTTNASNPVNPPVSVQDPTNVIESIRQLQSVRLEVSSVVASVQQIAGLTDPESLRATASRLHESFNLLRSIAETIDPALVPGVPERVAGFEALVVGRAGITGARERELAITVDAERLLKESSEASGRLTLAVNQLVAAASLGIRDANQQARTSRRFSSAIVLTVVLLSVISSVLIVWLYVERNLVARLTQLSNSMLAIAGGNLRAALPTPGDDEIGRMGQALRVFRDTAVEVEQANLREIQETRTRLTDAIESVSEGFALYDRDDRLVISNSKYRELLYGGRDHPLTPGTKFEEIVRNAAETGLIEDAGADLEGWLATRIERHRNPTGPHHQQRVDGRWIQVNEHKTENGGTVAIYTDITELTRRGEAAEAATREKSRFLASMSHELRTPLNAIIGLTEMLREDADLEGPESFKEPLRRIHRAGNHLLQLIDDLLDLSRIEAGKLTLRLEEVDVGELARDAAETSAPLAENNQNTLEIELDDQLGTMRADPTRVRQIILNLLSNAFKFTQNGTVSLRVRRSAETSRDWIEFSVSDTGIGMSNEQMKRLFEEFSQVEDGVRRHKPGAGLGLAICQRLCRMMGGSISVESEPAAGSTFRVRLPTETQPAQATAHG